MVENMGDFRALLAEDVIFDFVIEDRKITKWRDYLDPLRVFAAFEGAPSRSDGHLRGAIERLVDRLVRVLCRFPRQLTHVKLRCCFNPDKCRSALALDMLVERVTNVRIALMVALIGIAAASVGYIVLSNHVDTALACQRYQSIGIEAISRVYEVEDRAGGVPLTPDERSSTMLEAEPREQGLPKCAGASWDRYWKQSQQGVEMPLQLARVKPYQPPKDPVEARWNAEVGTTMPHVEIMKSKFFNEVQRVCDDLRSGGRTAQEEDENSYLPAQLLIEVYHVDQLYGDWKELPQSIRIVCPEQMSFVDQALSGDYPKTPITVFGSGTKLVGVDVPPGTYRTIGDRVINCHLTRTDMQGHGVDDQTMPIGQSLTVTIAPSDASFFSEGCGSWKLVEKANS